MTEIPIAVPVSGESPKPSAPEAPSESMLSNDYHPNALSDIISFQPDEAIESVPFQAMSVVPSNMVLCRSCQQSFLRHEGDRGTAQYYRCRDCTSTEALMISLTYACTVS